MEKDTELSLKDNYVILQYKIQSPLLRGKGAIHHTDFCCLNCLRSFATENKRESLKTNIFVTL